MKNEDILNELKKGRPTKYSDDILIKSYKYVTEFNERNQFDENNPHKFIETIPTVVGLSKFINIARDTIYNWIKDEDKSDFSDIIKRLEEEKELILVNYGLLKRFDTKIATIMLSQINIREIKETKQDISVFSNLSDDEIKAEIERLKKEQE